MQVFVWLRRATQDDLRSLLEPNCHYLRPGKAIERNVIEGKNKASHLNWGGRKGLGEGRGGRILRW